MIDTWCYNILQSIFDDVVHYMEQLSCLPLHFNPLYPATLFNLIIFRNPNQIFSAYLRYLPIVKICVNHLVNFNTSNMVINIYVNLTIILSKGKFCYNVLSFTNQIQRGSHITYQYITVQTCNKINAFYFAIADYTFWENHYKKS